MIWQFTFQGDILCEAVFIYRKIPIISPGLMFVQKAVLLGLLSVEPIFGGAYYWKEFCVSKWVGFDNKTPSTNSPWAYIWEGFLSEGFLHPRFGGLIFGRAFNILSTCPLTIDMIIDMTIDIVMRG